MNSDEETLPPPWEEEASLSLSDDDDLELGGGGLDDGETLGSDDTPAAGRERVRQGLRFCFTWHVDDAHAQAEFELVRDHLETLVALGRLQCALGGLEAAPTTGKMHIQGYLEAAPGTKQVTYKQLIETVEMSVGSELWNTKPSVRAADGSYEQNKQYCFGLTPGKEPNEHRFEFGTPRPTRSAKGSGRKRKAGVDYAGQLDMIREGKLHETEPRLQICHFANMLRINFSYPRDLTPLSELKNEWVWGPPGIGKTTYAHEKAESLGLQVYVKDALTKWWDGYGHQPFVIVDDLEKECKYQLHLLKMIGDHRPTRVEIKGAYTEIRPRHVIVTSNYSIDEVFEDSMARAAVRRRYLEVHMGE